MENQTISGDGEAVYLQTTLCLPSALDTHSKSMVPNLEFQAPQKWLWRFTSHLTFLNAQENSYLPIYSMKVFKQSIKQLSLFGATLTPNQFSSVQLLSRVRLLTIPWTAACQAALSVTKSRSCDVLVIPLDACSISFKKWKN